MGAASKQSLTMSMVIKDLLQRLPMTVRLNTPLSQKVETVHGKVPQLVPQSTMCQESTVPQLLHQSHLKKVTTTVHQFKHQEDFTVHQEHKLVKFKNYLNYLNAIFIFN